MTTAAAAVSREARHSRPRAVLAILLPLVLSASAAAGFEVAAGIGFGDFSMRVDDRLDFSAAVTEVRLEAYIDRFGEEGPGIGVRARGMFRVWDNYALGDCDAEALETAGYDLKVLFGWTLEVEGFRFTPLLGAHYSSYRADYRPDDGASRIEQEFDMLSLEVGLRLDSGSNGELPLGGCIQFTAGPIIGGRTREVSRDFGEREGEVERGFVIDLSITGRVVILDCGFGVEYAWRELGGDLDRTDQQWGLRFHLGIGFGF